MSIDVCVCIDHSGATFHRHRWFIELASEPVREAHGREGDWAEVYFGPGEVYFGQLGRTGKYWVLDPAERRQ